jgi:2-keto-4-pentenoate hydratase/2-oxohepta-3-ene-1,7-dioic acid hydratase in catechol pathway
VQLASFSHKGVDRIGVRRDETHVIVIQELPGSDLTRPPRMIDLIRAGQTTAAETVSAALDSTQAEIIALEDLSWQPPIPNPGKIVGVAMNNSASNARKISAPDHPAFFLKPPSCLVAHENAIHIRPYYGSVHPEPELAVVMGQETRDVDASDAMERIFGYSIFNDITGNGMRADDLFHYWALYANDSDPEKLDRREQHLSYAARYKGTDTFGCMGPWLTTADEIPDPDNLDVHCSAGDEVIAEDSTRYYNYKIAELVSYLSQFQTLMPGDIISCGTAFRPSPGRKSIHHANLQHNPGPVIVRITGLGELLNAVTIDDRPLGRWRLPKQDGSQEVD